MASPVIRKAVYIIVFYGLYFNVLLFLLIPSVYSSPLYLSFLAVYYAVGIIDTAVRPVTEEDKDMDKYTSILLVFWLLHPFIFTLMYQENTYLTQLYLSPLESSMLAWLGLLVYAIGGAISIASRLQLGRHGSGRLIVQKDHGLVTTGLYRRVRNPMYTGGLVGTVAFGMVFRSLLVMIMDLATYFIIFRRRMLREEDLMEQEFGEAYLDYKRKTKRLIPGVY
jgi:protein-S-isoprenylcysteine O-methyltransferase Ste14